MPTRVRDARRRRAGRRRRPRRPDDGVPAGLRRARHRPLLAVSGAADPAERRRFGALAVAKDCAKTGCVASTANTYANYNADDGKSNVDEVCGTGSGPPCVLRNAVGAGRREVRQGDHEHQSGVQRVQSEPDQLRCRSRARPRRSWSRRAAPGPDRSRQRRGRLGIAGRGHHPSAHVLRLRVPASTSRPRRRCRPGRRSPARLQVSTSMATRQQVAARPVPRAPICRADSDGWLNPHCKVTVTAGGWVNDDTGNNGSSCINSALVNTTVLLPVYDQLTGTGSGGKYHIVGFAAFYLTGFKFNGNNKSPSTMTCPDQRQQRRLHRRLFHQVHHHRPYFRRPGHGRHHLQACRIGDQK